MRRRILAVALALWSPELWAQSPPRCSLVTRGNTDQCLGSILVRAPNNQSEVLLDGTTVGKGSLLLRRILPGAHVVEVRPGGTAPPTQLSLTVLAGGLHVVPSGGVGLTGTRAPVLAEAWFGYTDECDGIFHTSSSAIISPIDLERLAVLGRDRRLQPFIPTVTTELARTQDACRAGDGAACARAGEQAANGAGGRARDAARAATFFRRGCDLHERAACAAFAEQLATGSGIPRDAARAASLRERLCGEGDFASCDALGDDLAFGAAGGLQRRRGLSLLEKACAGGVQRSCDVIPTVRLHIACDNADPTACRTLNRPLPAKP